MEKKHLFVWQRKITTKLKCGKENSRPCAECIEKIGSFKTQSWSEINTELSMNFWGNMFSFYQKKGFVMPTTSSH